MKPARKQVALTFDDGPNGDYTLEILRILKTYNIKAAFFFPGKNVERMPRIALKVKNDGHAIGSHTYDHPHLNQLNKAQILFQIEKTESVFKDILGIKPRYFRPPYGEYNKDTESILGEKGYMLILWDEKCSSMDWLENDPIKIAYNATENAKDGSLILLHDGRNIREGVPKNNTVKALPIIIENIRKKGFEIVAMDKICKGRKDR